METIKGYQLIGENYEAAWNDLKKRYDRKEETIQEYIRKFLETPAIMFRANQNRLRAIIDAANQMMRALPGMGCEVSNWDPFILLIITAKLDEATRLEWKQKMGRKETSRVSDLLDFLETRAIELQPGQGDRLSQMLKGEKVRANKKVFALREQSDPPVRVERADHVDQIRCAHCHGNHHILQCKRLAKLCARAQTRILSLLRLCFKCFGKHRKGECDRDDCSYCGGPHHLHLCYKRENANTAQRNPQGVGNGNSNAPKKNKGIEFSPNIYQKPEDAFTYPTPNQSKKKNKKVKKKPQENGIPAGYEDDWSDDDWENPKNGK